MAPQQFRVAIVGGSIAGLTLALALERSGIDFVVLEAYREMATQVGASIAILPNGFRILDQLGCYEDILQRVNCTIDNFIIRDFNGKTLTHVEHLDHHLVQRHGYPMIFFERRMLIEVLYQHIKQKEKVRTSKRVDRIEEGADGVSVYTHDGERIKADVVVGADAVHSTVGKEMARTTAGKDSPAKNDELPVQYRCLFGISKKVPGIAEDTLHHVTNTGSSLFTASGPNDRTYWCLFLNTGTTHRCAASLPSFDEAATARAHAADAVTETVTYPRAGAAATLRLLSEAYPGAASLQMLPLPADRPRALPYADELRRRPAARSARLNGGAVGALAGLGGLGGLGCWWALLGGGGGAVWGASVLVRRGEAGGDGGGGFARLLRALLAGYGVLAVLLPLLAVVLVEGARKRHARSLAASPSLWIAQGQLFGRGIVLPLYVLALFSASSGTAYWMPAERCVPHAASKAILPALLVGVLLPSALMLSLGAGCEHMQEVAVALWPAAPVLVGPLSVLFARALRPPADLKAPVEDHQGLDLPHLRRLYDVLFVVAAAVHVAVLAFLGLASGEVSITGAFAPLHLRSPVSTAVAAGMKTFFQFDLLLVVAAMFIWAVLNVLDMKRVGITGAPVLKTVGLLLVGQLAVGPGATLVAFWRWREGKVARPELKESSQSPKSKNAA